MWTIFKVFIGFVTILLLLCFGFFHHKACEILALQPRFKPSPPALEGEVLTTGLPGKSLDAPSCLLIWPSPSPLSFILPHLTGHRPCAGHVMDQSCQQIHSSAPTNKPAGKTSNQDPSGLFRVPVLRLHLVMSFSSVQSLSHV